MAFKDIEGQQKAVEFFHNAVNKNRLAHAYLFLGAQGLGKTLFAHNLAKFLNCQAPIKDGEMIVDCCDVCNSCQKIDHLNHPDVHRIELTSRKKISIDEIRLLQKEASLKPYEGKFKIFVILQADQMSEEASHSLLKTLEEPPDQCLLILTAEDASDLLPTIISRCQVVKFYPLNCEKIKEILTKRLELKSADAHFLSVQAEGRIGLALSLQSQDVLNKKNSLIDRVLDSKQSGLASAADIFNFKDKAELAKQIRYLLIWFRDISACKAGLSHGALINADRINTIKALAQQMDFERLEQIIGEIEKAYKMIDINVNTKITIEVMLREMTKCNR